MSLPNSSAPHYLTLKPHVGDTLAQNPLLNTAYGIAVGLSSEASVSRSLILTASLLDTLRRDPHLIAVALLSDCVADRGIAVIEKVREAGLNELTGSLRYFLTTPLEPGKFATVQARWERDIERWTNATDELKVIRLAKMADTLRRKEWFNFLQRQQMLEHASMFVEAFTMKSSANQLWVDDLGILVSELSRAGESRTSALKRVLR